MNLTQFFQHHPKIALAFSGGVDSAYLLYEAVRSGASVRAYYVRSAFQPEFEVQDALRLAAELEADLRVLETDVLCVPEIAENSADRCYYCKSRIFRTILKAAVADGFTELMDGTNASDSVEDRPGMRALRELHVYSPLREAGLTKKEIRRLSREAGLFTWDKPAYACLATRVATGEPITTKKLQQTEKAEDYLFSLGFSDFRVRLRGDTAHLQFRQDQINKAREQWPGILKKLENIYSHISPEPEVRA